MPRQERRTSPGVLTAPRNALDVFVAVLIEYVFKNERWECQIELLAERMGVRVNEDNGIAPVQFLHNDIEFGGPQKSPVLTRKQAHSIELEDIHRMLNFSKSAT